MQNVIEDADFGIIYVLSEPTGKLSKIGRTSSGTAVARALSYGKAHGQKWSVANQFPTLRVAEVEANIHAHLSLKRLQTETGAKEIFHLRPKDTVVLISKFIIPPDTRGETYKIAVQEHARRVRSRLSAQMSYLRSPSRRGYSTEDTIRIEIYTQFLALDALERGIGLAQMLEIYGRVLSDRTREIARLKDEHLSRFKAAWGQKSFLSKIFGGTPYIKEEVVDDARFPKAPYYAVNLIGTSWAEAQA